jgi:hypothetical protein
MVTATRIPVEGKDGRDDGPLELSVQCELLRLRRYI